MPFYLSWLCKREYHEKIFLKLLHFYLTSLDHISEIWGCFFQFWSTLILAMCGINISGPSSPIKQPFFQTNKPTKKTTNELTFQCKLYSIPLKLRCDGTPHCMPDGEDEKDCLKGNIF